MSQWLVKLNAPNPSPALPDAGQYTSWDSIAPYAGGVIAGVASRSWTGSTWVDARTTIVRLDSDGGELWRMTLEKDAATLDAKLLIIPSGLVLWARDELLLLNPETGETIWSRVLSVFFEWWNNSYETSQALALHPSGDILLTGTDWDAGGLGVLARVSASDGSSVWSRSLITAADSPYSGGVICAADGDAVAVFVRNGLLWVGKFSSVDGTPVWVRETTLELNGIVAASPSGDIYVSGQRYYSESYIDLMKMDSAGSVAWVRRYDKPPGTDQVVAACSANFALDRLILGVSSGGGSSIGAYQINADGSVFGAMEFDTDGTVTCAGDYLYYALRINGGYSAVAPTKVHLNDISSGVFTGATVNKSIVALSVSTPTHSASTPSPSSGDALTTTNVAGPGTLVDETTVALVATLHAYAPTPTAASFYAGAYSTSTQYGTPEIAQRFTASSISTTEFGVPTLERVFSAPSTQPHTQMGTPTLVLAFDAESIEPTTQLGDPTLTQVMRATSIAPTTQLGGPTAGMIYSAASIEPKTRLGLPVAELVLIGDADGISSTQYGTPELAETHIAQSISPNTRLGTPSLYRGATC